MLWAYIVVVVAAVLVVVDDDDVPNGALPSTTATVEGERRTVKIITAVMVTATAEGVLDAILAMMVYVRCVCVCVCEQLSCTCGWILCGWRMIC